MKRSQVCRSGVERRTIEPYRLAYVPLATETLFQQPGKMNQGLVAASLTKSKLKRSSGSRMLIFRQCSETSSHGIGNQGITHHLPHSITSADAPVWVATTVAPAALALVKTARSRLGWIVPGLAAVEGAQFPAFGSVASGRHQVQAAKHGYCETGGLGYDKQTAQLMRAVAH